MRDPELQGCRVLVTRPLGQAQDLVDGIQRLGGEAICLPLLVIKSIEPDQLPRLATSDLLLFISPNAVDHGLHWLGEQCASVRLGAIGHATATRLAQAGFKPELVPAQANTEGMLALPALQQVVGKRIVIVRGRGGREKLASTLRQRGATVNYLEVYERSRPRWQEEDVAVALHADIITVTSGEALDNLGQLARLPGGDQLWSKPLLVIHARIAAQAQELGFTLKPVISEKPGDEAMLKALREWAKQHKDMERA